MPLDRALQAPKSLTAEEIAAFLATDDVGAERDLFAAARAVKEKVGRTETLPRGLIECSNICVKDCLYCGIRKGNGAVARYKMTEDEVRACIDEARRRGYPAVAFQAGEVEGEANTAFYERLVDAAASPRHPDEKPLEVTLSLGEQTEDVYRRWKDAGALRYLIRIETSNRELYAKIHPSACSFDRRLGCIRTLKRLGYVTGTGVMIGLPGQTLSDLANDIVFFGAENVDMVGMGPYVPAPGTPLAQTWGEGQGQRSRSTAEPETFHCSPSPNPFTFSLSLRMIALTRLYLHDVNIVAATALEALDPENGRNRGIAAGANVIMPNLTPSRYRENYSLYPGKA